VQSSVDDKRARLALIVLASLVLTNCGGGGGGGGGGGCASGVVVGGGVAVFGGGIGAGLSTVPGTVFHGDTVTIFGSGFGVKSPVLPAVLDGASGTNILDKWDGFWPSQNATYNLAYRDLPPCLSPPHSRANNRVISGAHYSSDGPDGGYNVMFWKNRTIASYPAYTYASWYQRNDDAWSFQDNSNVEHDNNLKAIAFSVCCSPYELPNNWYIEYNPRPSSPTSGATWNITDDGASLQFPDQNNHNSFWGNAVNPMSGVWTKIEVEIKYTNQSNGYIKLWENGTQKINYVGRTDSYPGNMRTEGIGGYARSRSANNWRYFTEVYFDYTPARVVLTDSPTFGSATIVETQIPTAWSDTSITFGVNLGKFNSGQTAWLFVVNLCGQPSNSGIQVQIP
jgi:hypothetical protein